MINKMPVMVSIGEKYGSKKGFLKYYYHQILDRIFNRYKHYKTIHGDCSRIIFVCKGNICRSSYAEWLFKTKSNIPVFSVGLETTTGKPANARIVELSAKLGLPLDSHRTTSIDDFSYQKGDVFVCMEPYQAQVVASIIKDAKIVLLGAFSAKKSVYIHDPYSASDSYVKVCLLHISECTTNLVAVLNSSAKS